MCLTCQTIEKLREAESVKTTMLPTRVNVDRPSMPKEQLADPHVLSEESQLCPFQESVNAGGKWKGQSCLK